MKRIIFYLLTIFCLILLTFSNQPLQADESISVDINIIDQPAQFNKKTPVIVAGLWHNISFSGLTNIDNELVLTVHKGSSIPLQQNKTNYYQWKYTPLTLDSWQKTTTYGKETINPNYCQTTENSITFCIGIPDYLPEEIFYNQAWTLRLSTTDKTIFDTSFYLEKPTRGFAKSHGDRLSFAVDPFTEMQSKASDYLILKNTGNVPLNITLDFDVLDNLLTYTESSKQIPAHSQQNYKLILNAPSWKPQRISQRGSASALVSNYYLLGKNVSGTAISLQTAFTIDVPTINIFVGHNSYKLITLDKSTGFTFQYQKQISMYEGETKTLTTYLSGEGTATVSIQTNNNISLLKLTRNNKLAQSPFTVISTNAEEQVISLQIKALSENRHGKINYIIETDEGTKTFTSTVKVKPPAPTEEPTPIGATSPVTIIVLLALIIAAGYMLYNHLIHGRSERR